MRGHEVFPGTSLAKRLRRRQLLKKRRKRTWLNATAGASIVALMGIAVLGALLSGRGGAGDAAAVVEDARRSAITPRRLIVEGARTHRIVILGDVPGSSAAKRVAAEAVRGMALGPGLDVLVLDIDRTAQPYIDAYLEAPTDNVSILLAHPEVLPGGGYDYLDIYRLVWNLNQKLGADRAITIVAAGLPGWPPVGVLAPRTEAELYARRGQEMARLIERGVFGRVPKARILVFVDGYQALRSGWGTLSAGGGAPVRVSWLGALLERAHPGEVYAVLQDGPPGGLREGSATSYTGTRAYQIFRDAAGPRAPFGLLVGASFRFLRQPIVTTSSPGTQLTIQPANYRLGNVVDGYIYLGPH